MTPIRVFISSVQKEFAAERAALRDYLRGDALMRRFFEAFLFEDVPAADRRVDQLYLDEVARCDIYVGLFGQDYGSEDAEGVSPTEREFDRATELHKTRLVFVKGTDDTARHPKMRALVRNASAGLTWKEFGSTAELIAGVYAALVQHLESAALIRTGPFDAAPCLKATVADLDADRMARFVRRARQARGFPLPDGVTSEELLTHLNLLSDGHPTNAAVLLFGRHPQRFLLSSLVKCAHFHGTQVAKPIPSYQVYKGTAFELVDQAVDFVMSKLNLAVGTRAVGAEAPVAYEMPRDVVQEAVVNAIAHRDYSSHGSVQVMLFADRLEVWNPGALPPSLTVDMLSGPHGSVPGNPLLAESMYLAKYIERVGTGTGDMIRSCVAAGLAAPRFAVTDGFVVTVERRPGRAAELVSLGATAQVAPPVNPPVTPSVTPPVEPPVAPPVAVLTRLLGALGEAGNAEIRKHLGLKDRKDLRERYLGPCLRGGWVEMTIPDKPSSRVQKYRLTPKGREVLASLQGPHNLP